MKSQFGPDQIALKTRSTMSNSPPYELATVCCLSPPVVALNHGTRSEARADKNGLTYLLEEFSGIFRATQKEVFEARVDEHQVLQIASDLEPYRRC